MKKLKRAYKWYGYYNSHPAGASIKMHNFVEKNFLFRYYGEMRYLCKVGLAGIIALALIFLSPFFVESGTYADSPLFTYFGNKLSIKGVVKEIVIRGNLNVGYLTRDKNEKWKKIAMGDPVCRTGVGVPLSRDADFSVLRDAEICQVYDWGVFPETAITAAEIGLTYYPMWWGCRQPVRARRLEDAKLVAAAFPGLTWLMFNEPDLSTQANCLWNDEVAMDEAVTTYKMVTDAILSVDPTAKFACCGEGFATTYWTNIFRDKYIQKYGEAPKIDELHMHLYNHNFKEVYNTEELKTMFTNWMAWRTQRTWAQNLPVYITEFGPLISHYSVVDPDDANKDYEKVANEYIPEMVPWLLTFEDVKGIFWFSANFPERDASSFERYFYRSNICETLECSSLNIIGRRYIDFSR